MYVGAAILCNMYVGAAICMLALQYVCWRCNMYVGAAILCNMYVGAAILCNMYVGAAILCNMYVGAAILCNMYVGAEYYAICMLALNILKCYSWALINYHYSRVKNIVSINSNVNISIYSSEL